MPCLHSPVVSAIVPSALRMASAKIALGCCRQTFNRVALNIAASGRWRPRRSGGRSRPPWSDRDRGGAQGIEVGFITPQQFQVFQAGSAGQQVVGDVEHVVGIVVGQMNLQQAEVAVDGLVKPEPLGQQMNGPDAAVGGRRMA